MKNTVILFLVILFFGCTEKGQLNQRLVEIDTLLLREKPDSAKLLLDKIPSSSLQSDEEKAYYYMLLTHTKYWLYEPIKSDSLINFSVDYYSKTRDEKKLARSIYYRGMVLSGQGKSEDCIKDLKEAEALAEKNKDMLLCGKIYSNLSYINAEIGNYLKALSYVKKQLALAVEMDNKQNLADAYNRFSVVYTSLDNLDSALVYAYKSKEYIKYVDDTKKVNILTNLSVCYSNVKNYREAERYALQALKIKEEAHTYYMLGSIYIAQGKEQEAWNAWMKALNTHKIGLKIDVFDYIVEYKKLKGEHKEATRWNDSLLLYQDSLKHIQKTEKTLQIQNEVDMRKQERDSKAQTWTIVVCAGIFIIVLMLSLVCNYRKVAKSKLTMAEMLKQMDDYRKRVAELEASDRDHSLEVEDLRHQLEHLQTIRNELLEHGKQCYGQIVNGGTTTKWNKDDFEAVVEYYSSKYPEKVENIASAYSNLTSYNLFVLLLPEMGIAQDDIPRVLNNTMGAVRTMRSRISRKKKE